MTRKAKAPAAFKVDKFHAKDHGRRQSSLEHVFASTPPRQIISANERAETVQLVEQLLSWLTKDATDPASTDDANDDRRFRPDLLIRELLRHAFGDEGRDNIRRYLLTCVFTGLTDQKPDDVSFDEVRKYFHNRLDMWELERQQAAVVEMKRFAEHIRDHFFLPLRAAGGHTPSVSQSCSSGMAQAADLATSESRIKAYNRDCFLRDGYRCAITGAYETNWFLNRYSKEEPPPDAQSAPCEAAHIIPHAMGSGSMVNNDFESKVNARTILAMFAPQCVHLCEPVELDRPRNGITMTKNMHALFGQLRWYLEPVPGVEHTYIAQTPLPALRSSLPPPTQRISFAECPTHIDRPHPDLIALHRVASLVVHACGASEYIERVLRDRDEGVVRANGSTHLGALVAIGLSSKLGMIPVH